MTAREDAAVLQAQMDIEFLRGRLAHRASNTENERAAADYIRERLKACAPDTAADDFYSPDTPWYLFASYCAEFTVVSVLAIWWPRVALCYGAVVFLAYLAEVMGYQIMGRFLPHYETQNVVARFLAVRPKRMLVVMAHYDTGKAGLFAGLRTGVALRPVQMLITLAMVIVLTTCALQSLEVVNDAYGHVILGARWGAAVFLLCMAGAFCLGEITAEYTQIINDNASGTAALLRLAEKLAAQPIEGADVHLVATGSNQGWMNGARHYVTSQTLDRDTTYFVSIDDVASGKLAYTVAEGVLHLLPCSPALVAAAEAESAAYDAGPCRRWVACSDALIPLARGYKAIEVTAARSADAEVGEDEETEPAVDYGLVVRAADFVEAVLRRIAVE